MSTNPLLTEIETFLARPGVKITETAFGLKVMNDGKFISNLRDGRKVLMETAEKVRGFIRQYDEPEQPATSEAAE